MTARKRASFSFRGAGSGHRSRAQQSEEDNGAFSGEVADEDTGDHDGLLFSKVPKSFTFWRRCAGFLQSVMRTRTAFSAFLSSFLHVSRSDMAPISTLFPLPVPEVGMFQRMPANLPPSLPPSLALSLSSLSLTLSLSLHARRRLHLKRVLRITVMALNFWHGGLRSFPNESLLSRRPTWATSGSFAS